MTYKLEDMLNDCAVIRTTFDTLDLFPADDPIRAEMLVIVDEARANLRRRCAVMRDDAAHLTLFDRPLSMRRLRQALQTLLLTGYPRRHMDSCMKVNVFCVVEKAQTDGSTPDAPYRYILRVPLSAPAVLSASADTLTALILDDLLQSVESDASFKDKPTFDLNIFQKYVAFMFACYHADNPLFYS